MTMRILRFFAVLQIVGSCGISSIAAGQVQFPGELDVKSTFNITVDYREIQIVDRNNKTTISVEPPPWLKGKQSVVPRIVVDPHERFFVLYAGLDIAQYALNHELWALGWPMTGTKFNTSKDTAGYFDRVEITRVDRWKGALSFFIKTTDKDLIMVQRALRVEPPDVFCHNMLMNKPTWVQDSPYCAGLIKAAQSVREGLSGAKSLVALTGMHPHNPHSSYLVAPRDKRYNADKSKFLALKRAMGPQGKLRPEVNRQLGVWIKKLTLYQRDARITFNTPQTLDRVVAREVFAEIYK